MATLTTAQWVVLAVIFGAGLVLGLLLRSGGSKWRRLYGSEHEAHVALRREYDAHLARDRDSTPVEHATLRAGSF